MKYFLIFFVPALVASQSLLWMGGGDATDPVWEKMVEMAGGKGVARIGLFTTASFDPEGSAVEYVDMFVNLYGAASATYIPVTETSNNANDPALADLVAQQTGIFFDGGDQIRVTNALRPNGTDTLVLSAVKNLLRAGAVVGGTSAGTACQTSGVMVTGGVSWDALAFGAFAGTPSSSNDLSYEPFGGLGLMEGWLLDTHFSERGREGRLIRLLQDTRNRNIGTTLGLGVDQDMAIAITNLYTNPIGTVVGPTGGVLVVDVTNVVEYPSLNTHYENINTHYLTEGDSIDLATGAITYASWKVPLKGIEQFANAISSGDILSAHKTRQWADSAQQLFDNVQDDVSVHFSFEKKPQFQVTFNRTLGAGYGGYHPLYPTVYVVSYENLRVSIKEY